MKNVVIKSYDLKNDLKCDTTSYKAETLSRWSASKDKGDFKQTNDSDEWKVRCTAKQDKSSWYRF